MWPLTQDDSNVVTAASVLAHTHVDVAAFAKNGMAPRHLATTVTCVHSYQALQAAGLMRTLTLTIHTNEAPAVESMLASLALAPPSNSPGSWRVRVLPWNARDNAAGGSKRNNFMLAHAHLQSWTWLAGDRGSNATAFVHLEDDVCPRVESLLSWARDEALLRNSGASAAGFQRGFYRFEIARPANEMPPPPARSKYSAAYVARRAAWWRTTHNVSFGERFVLDERLHRRFSPMPPRGCDEVPCDARPAAAANTSSTTAHDRNVSSGALFGWCANYPVLVVHDVQTGQDRVFTSLANPYSAITAASRPLVEAFLLRSAGWRTGASSLRTRHKAYAVREYGSCTFHYANEFVRFRDAGANVRWPMGEFGQRGKTAGGMRRVLVPLVLSVQGSSPAKRRRWQLDTLAGLHHMSDRVVNGPRKGNNEAFSANHRENEVMRCVPSAPGGRARPEVPRGRLAPGASLATSRQPGLPRRIVVRSSHAAPSSVTAADAEQPHSPTAATTSEPHLATVLPWTGGRRLHMAATAATTMDANATEWACDLAAAQRSVADCAACTWWQPPELVPPPMTGGLRSGSGRGGEGRARPMAPPQPRTAWFMCVNKPQGGVDLIRARHSKFIQLVQVAVSSARLHAPSLAPYVLYMHGSDQRYDEVDDLSRWLTAQGVRIVNTRLSFADAIPPIRWRMRTLTGICKMDIPRVAHSLKAELLARGLEAERVLWTDADVLFAGDFEYPPSAPLPTFAAGTEVFSSSLNSGVIYGNVSTMVAQWPGMLQHAITHRFKFQVADQSWMQQWFRRDWIPLDDALYNARPFAHPHRPRGGAASVLKQPRIWHWHGYKGGDVECWLRAMANGTWPERAWRAPSGCAARRGACSYKPVRGSGCRYLGRITPSSCYLRTYTYLLRQHHALLQHARSSANGSRTQLQLAVPLL